MNECFNENQNDDFKKSLMIRDSLNLDEVFCHYEHGSNRRCVIVTSHRVSGNSCYIFLWLLGFCLLMTPYPCYSDTEIPIPALQRQFIEAIHETREHYYRVEYKTRSPSQDSVDDLLSQRKDTLLDLLRDEKINDWIGYLTFRLDKNERAGKEYITGRIEIGPHIFLNFERHEPFLNPEYDTSVASGSPLASSLQSMNNGSLVKVWGEFFVGGCGILCETSVTTDGAIREPEFLFVLEKIQLIFGVTDFRP